MATLPNICFGGMEYGWARWSGPYFSPTYIYPCLLLNLFWLWLIHEFFFGIECHAALVRNPGLGCNTLSLRLIPGDFYSTCPNRQLYTLPAFNTAGLHCQTPNLSPVYQIWRQFVPFVPHEKRARWPLSHFSNFWLKINMVTIFCTCICVKMAIAYRKLLWQIWYVKGSVVNWRFQYVNKCYFFNLVSLLMA